MSAFLNRQIKRVRHIHAVSSALSRPGSSVTNLWKGYWLLLLDQLQVTGPELRLLLRSQGKPFALHSNNVTDFSLLFDVFLEKEYELAETLEAPSHILDLGSHVGLSVAYFATLFPGAAIRGYEPDRANFRRLLKNTSQFPNVRVHNMAVGPKSGTVSFFENDRRGFSSSVRDPARGETTEVPMASLDSILEAYDEPVDLLKFDIEGTEEPLFKNTGLLSKVQHCIGELHVDLIEGDAEAFCQHFEGFETRLTPLAPSRFLFFAKRHS